MKEVLTTAMPKNRHREPDEKLLMSCLLVNTGGLTATQQSAQKGQKYADPSRKVVDSRTDSLTQNRTSTQASAVLGKIERDSEINLADPR